MTEMHSLTLTWEQFDAVEEAADIMALGHQYFDTLEEAIHYLAQKYIDEHGPQFEAKWCDENHGPSSSCRPFSSGDSLKVD